MNSRFKSIALALALLVGAHSIVMCSEQPAPTQEQKEAALSQARWKGIKYGILINAITLALTAKLSQSSNVPLTQTFLGLSCLHSLVGFFLHPILLDDEAPEDICKESHNAISLEEAWSSMQKSFLRTIGASTLIAAAAHGAYAYATSK